MPLTRRVPANMNVVLGIAAIVAIMYFADEVFMPLALAALLSFLLTPVAYRLERLGLNRLFSTLVATAAAAGLLAGVFYVVANQFLGLVQDLPKYKSTLIAKLDPVHSPLGEKLDETTETFKELSEELGTKKPDKASKGAPRIPKVEVVQPPPTPMQVVTNVFGPVMKPIGTAAVVLLFVIFMLLERESLRDRLIRLTGAGDLQRTTRALDDATHRITRYLAMQTLINGIQGAIVAAGLSIIGVPSAVLWGALTIVLRFIPYLGPWIAAVMPIAVSIAVFEGWNEPLMVVGLIVTLELISNNVLEPWLYGHQTGVSPLALLVAAVFWTWLWGMPGLFLAIPLTVSLVVIGKYVPQLEFFNVLLGDEPALEPHERFYQRLLASEPEDAEEILEAARAVRPFEVFDTVLVPALGLAQHDFNRGALEAEQRRYIFEHLGHMAEDLSEPARSVPTDRAGGPAMDARPPVLCVPAHEAADGLAAAMFASLAESSGMPAHALEASSFKGEYLKAIEELEPACLCIAALPPAAATHASYLCKLVRARFPELPIVVGLWSARGNVQKASARLAGAGASRIVETFSAGITELGHVLERAGAPVLPPLEARRAASSQESSGVTRE